MKVVLHFQSAREAKRTLRWLPETGALALRGMLAVVPWDTVDASQGTNLSDGESMVPKAISKCSTLANCCLFFERLMLASQLRKQVDCVPMNFITSSDYPAQLAAQGELHFVIGSREFLKLVLVHLTEQPLYWLEGSPVALIDALVAQSARAARNRANSVSVLLHRKQNPTSEWHLTTLGEVWVRRRANQTAESLLKVIDLSIVRLAQTSTSEFSGNEPHVDEESGTQSVVTTAEVMRYWMQGAVHLASREIRRVLRHQESRVVAVEDVGLANGRHCELRNGILTADPFLWSHDGNLFALVEMITRPRGRGSIAVFCKKHGDWTYLGTALEEPHHLSFPWIFEFAGDLFMVPESTACGDVTLYRCTEWPLKWERLPPLLSGARSADHLIFQWRDSWWMFSNPSSTSRGEFSSLLNVHFADDPVRGPWQAHPNNPVMANPQGARNAGLLVSDGRVIRFGQNQKFGEYGASVSAFEITRLTRTEFSQSHIPHFTDQLSRQHDGVHHVSIIGDHVAFDYLD